MPLTKELGACSETAGKDGLSFSKLTFVDVTACKFLTEGDGIKAWRLVVTISESVGTFKFGESFIEAALSKKDVTEVIDSGNEAGVIGRE